MSYKKFCIGVDAFGLNHGISGTGSYLSEIVKNVPERDFEFCLFGHELDKYTYTSSSTNISFKGINIRDNALSEAFWHKSMLNSFIEKNNFHAVIYVSGFSLLPVKIKTPSFLIVNSVPKTSNFLSNIYIKQIIKDIKGIIVPSEYIKDALISFGVPQFKIAIIYNGVNHSTFKPIEKEVKDIVFIQPFSIKRPYIIYVSSLANTLKSHVELIRAFDLFKKKRNTAHKLVIAGAEGDASPLVRKEILKSHYSSDILLTGYFPHESLSKLYANADIAIFPSRNEGSALSVLEAMASGVPTACSNEGALKEVAKDASIYFDSTSLESIENAIESLITKENNFTLRQTLIEKGILCAKDYSWKKTAEESIDYILSQLKTFYKPC